MADSPFASASEHATSIREKEMSCRELAELYVGRIQRHNPALHAIVISNEAEAIRTALAESPVPGRGAVGQTPAAARRRWSDRGDVAGSEQSSGCACRRLRRTPPVPGAPQVPHPPLMEGGRWPRQCVAGANRPGRDASPERKLTRFARQRPPVPGPLVCTGQPRMCSISARHPAGGRSHVGGTKPVLSLRPKMQQVLNRAWP